MIHMTLIDKYDAYFSKILLILICDLNSFDFQKNPIESSLYINTMTF